MYSNKADYNAYMRQYMADRYTKRRAYAVELLGGKCCSCGSSSSLELDHVDKNAKTASMDRMASWSEARFLKELQLCQLLCKTCHGKKTKANGDYAHRAECNCAICTNARLVNTKASVADS